MAQLRVENLQGLQIKVPETTTKSVLALVQQNFIDWMHACGGKGKCTTCKMVVLSGSEGLSAPSAFEEKMRRLKKLAESERLACQTQVIHGTVVVRVPPETQLPHMTYN